MDLNNYYLYALYRKDQIGLIRYIGITNNPSNRLRQHLQYNSHNKHKINWINKAKLELGNNPIIMELLEKNLSIDDAKILEISEIYICKYKIGFDLLNKTMGGDLYYKTGIKAWNKGLTKENDERIMKISLALQKPKNEKEKERLRNLRKNIPHTEDIKEHLRKRGLENANKYMKQILSIKDGIVILYESITKASKILNIPASDICKVLKRKQHTCKGYKFIYYGI